MTENQEPSELEIRRKRLIFRSWHRGTKEMDLILGTFANTHVPFFSESELESYERILGCNDPDLYDWISGKTEPPANMIDDVFKKIRTRHAITKV
ncbi:MAG: succinate dehydrogenase assembly factor 2 [Alphaproteobacteria bacterium]|nr:succinate dehydrogenase assembly factor 2 [Alphaproteobacteria bacterium]MBP7762241.1 succinate dehydrogenase assembly factor 2 [Alphaproteobacteria bacterium]MBP7904182.1 succinate dehydrogenase assembly factor 2 [Alphaproteobacteria bacterium]